MTLRAGLTARPSAVRLLLSAFCLLICSCVYWTPLSKGPGTQAKVIPNVPLQQWDIKSCGAGALSSVLQHHGDDTTMEQWDAALQKTRGGVMSIDLVLAARRKGFDARLVTGDRPTVERELLDGRPVILMVQVIDSPGSEYDFFHYIVLDGIDPGRRLLRAQFGDKKARWIQYERIQNAWRGGGHAAILIRPNDPATEPLRAAVVLEENGRHDEAAREYRRILHDHPDSVLAWTNLGNVEMQRGNRHAAEEAFRKALALDASSADTLNNLAWLLYEEKRLEEAETLARQAVATPAPDRWMRLDTLARIQLERGVCTEALQLWEEALQAIPATRSKERSEMSLAVTRARESCHS